MKFLRPLFLPALILLFMPLTGAQAEPVPVEFITGETLAGQYAAGGGTLTINDTCSIFVDAPTDETYVGGTVFLVTTLAEDLSAGGRAKGRFTGGTLSFTDALGTDIVTFSLGELILEELFTSANILAGAGILTPTSGFHADSFSGGGHLVQVSFAIPGTLTDFQSDHSMVSNVTVSPVPEPATMALLGLGLTGLLVRRRMRGPAAA